MRCSRELNLRAPGEQFPNPEIPDLYDELAESAWALSKTTVVNNSTEDGVSWDADPADAISNVVRIYLVRLALRLS